MCGKKFHFISPDKYFYQVVFHHIKLPLVLANPSGNAVNINLGKSQAVKMQLCHRDCAFPITPAQEQQMCKQLCGIAFLCQ